jgi:hypothetical protein
MVSNDFRGILRQRVDLAYYESYGQTELTSPHPESNPLDARKRVPPTGSALQRRETTEISPPLCGTQDDMARFQK